MKKMPSIWMTVFVLGAGAITVAWLWGGVAVSDNQVVAIIDRGTGEVVGHSDKLGGTVTMHPGYSPLSPETVAEIEAGRMRKRLWKGTMVHPSRNASGEELILQETVCTVFQSMDTEVPERQQTFQECFSIPAVKCTGWNAAIEKVTAKDSGWIVKMRVRPELVSDHPSTYTTDSWIEEWSYSSGNLSFINGYRPSNDPAGGILIQD